MALVVNRAFLDYYFWENVLGLIAVLQLVYTFRRYFIVTFFCINAFIHAPWFFICLCVFAMDQLASELYGNAFLGLYVFGGDYISVTAKRRRRRDEALEIPAHSELLRVGERGDQHKKSSMCRLAIYPLSVPLIGM